ncbi:hypothetical protein S40288_00911 [Stachybotrys chartarum IBT 40288]|nr:hypothetical protein S40288_00911 [Stachybotrys chartarum IBT 40288]
MSLPLKVKIGIRDVWSRDGTPLRKAIASVKDVLGLDIVCEPDWVLLLAALGEAYPDKADFVTAVTSTVQVWFEALHDLLDGGASEDWTEALLDRLKETYSQLSVFLDVRKTERERPFTQWDQTRGGFIIYLPNETVHSAREFRTIFTGQIIAAFEKNAEELDLPSDAVDQAASEQQDGWATVEGSTLTIVAKSQHKPEKTEAPAAGKAIIQYLPDVESLPRPEVLLLQPPYHLLVYSRVTQEVEVQCSHGPTLEVLQAYLKKWCRTNHQNVNKTPALTIKLHQSSFGLGVVYDRLTILAEDRDRWGGAATVSPTLVLNLVESRLGYEKTYCDSYGWHFRRDVPFKKYT